MGSDMHADHQDMPVPVSVWRKLFAANKWNELQVRLIRVVDDAAFLLCTTLLTPL